MARIGTQVARWAAAAIPRSEHRRAGLCVLGVVAAFMMTNPSASADPTPPPSGDDVATPVSSGGPAPAPAGVPHLPSPENLPPGTTDAPSDPAQGRGVAYLRELWHALQTQDVSMDDALLLLTQRPLDPNAVPPPGLPSGPQQPLSR